MTAATVALSAAGAHRHWRLVCTRSASSGWEAYFRRVDLLPTADDGAAPARGGTATGGHPGSDASRAFNDVIDDHTGNAYQTAANPGGGRDWVAYDAGHAIPVQRVMIWQFGQAGNHVEEFEVQCSDDGETWRGCYRSGAVAWEAPYDSAADAGAVKVEGAPPAPAAGGSASGGGGGIPPAAHRHWRIVVTQSASSGWECYFKRIDLLPSTAANAAPARGGVATGYNAGGTPANAFNDIHTDNNNAYRTVPNPGAVKDWVAYDAGRPIEVRRVKIWQLSGGNAVEAFELQHSDDGRAWTAAFRTGMAVGETYDSEADAAKATDVAGSTTAGGASVAQGEAAGDPIPPATAVPTMGPPPAEPVQHPLRIYTAQPVEGAPTTGGPGDPHRYWRVVAVKASPTKYEGYYKRIDLLDANGTPASRAGTAFACTGGVYPNAAFTDALDAPLGESCRTALPPAADGKNDWVGWDAGAPGIRVADVMIWQPGIPTNHIHAVELQYSDTCADWKVALRSGDIAVAADKPYDSRRDPDAKRYTTPTAGVAAPVKQFETSRTWGIDDVDSMQTVIMPGPGPKANVRVFFNESVALMVNKAYMDKLPDLEKAVETGAIFEILKRLKCIVDSYVTIVRKNPQNGERGYKGRIRVEIGELEFAAGLACHGLSGCAIGPGFLQETLKHWVEGRKVIHQIFFYELMRNYLFTDLVPTLEYSTADEGDTGGHIQQAHVQVTGLLLVKEPGLYDFDFQYAGQLSAEIFEENPKKLNPYLEGHYKWEDVFMRNRLPWDKNVSLDNAYDCVLMHLVYMNHRKSPGSAYRYLRRFFVGLPYLRHRRGKHQAPSMEMARDNFVLAHSFAAGEDLSEYFATKWKWPIGKEVATEMPSLLKEALACDIK